MEVRCKEECSILIIVVKIEVKMCTIYWSIYSINSELIVRYTTIRYPSGIQFYTL